MTRADVERAKTEAVEEAVKLVWSIFFTVLRDKEGYEIDGLCRVWDEAEKLSDSISQGYCTASDLRDVLKQEIGASFA